MRHPFDGVNQPVGQPEQSAEEPRGLTRRSALEKMVFATAGFVAVPALLRAQIAVTNAINENGGPVATTFAVGEEGAATTAVREAGGTPASTEPFGEEAGKVTSRPAAGLETGVAGATPPTTAANEAGQPATKALKEQATTNALNEEGGVATTLALGEEGAVTRAANEAGGLTKLRGEDGAGVVQVQPGTTELTPKQLATAWADLADSDAGKAVQACAVIYGSKQAVPYLKEHLNLKFPPFDEQKVAQLITDLDNDAFAVREKSQRQLAEMGPAALPSIKTALATTKSNEVRLRLQRILDESKDLGSLRQAERGLQVLVALRTPEAKELLTKLAGGNEKDWLTKTAKQALEQLPK